MLTSKQVRFLKAEAHDLKPIIQIGKEMVTETLITTINNALEKRELIKVSVLQNCLAEPKELAPIIAQNTKSEVVQVIGRTLVLFKKSSNVKNRTFSTQLPK